MPGVVAEAKRLPFRSNSADHVISIAMVHHLASEEHRVRALTEMVRTLKPGGSALVTVWAFEQRNKQGSKSKYIKTKNKSQALQPDHKSHETHETHGTKYLEKQEEERTSNSIDVDSQVGVKTHRESPFILETSSSDSLIPERLPVHKNRTAFEAQDVLVPWKCRESGETFLRYYHVFLEGELPKLCQGIPSLTVVKEFYDEGNWCLLFRKHLSETIEHESK